jgi:hypothetical protein
MGVENKFDESRIINRQVSLEEMVELEEKLYCMFVEKTVKEEKRIVLVRDNEEYKRLKDSKEIFKGDVYYLHVDEKNHVLDLIPILHHLIDTKEGKFYTKIILYDECHQS